MHQVTYKSLVLSFSILFLSVITGWLLTEKAVSHQSALEFVPVGIFIASILFLLKLIIFTKAKNRLFYQLLFIGGFGLDLSWFLTCFFVPLLWVKYVDLPFKVGVSAIYFSVCVLNIILAIKTFSVRWREVGARKFERIFTSTEKSVDWTAIFKAMKISPIIYLPGVSRNLDGLVSIILIFLLILGCLLRTQHPVLSLIAIGLPFSVFAACCLQMTSYRFAEARQVKIIEINKKTVLKASK